MSGEKFTFPVADGTVKLSGGTNKTKANENYQHRQSQDVLHLLTRSIMQLQADDRLLLNYALPDKNSQMTAAADAVARGGRVEECADPADGTASVRYWGP